MQCIGLHVYRLPVLHAFDLGTRKTRKIKTKRGTGYHGTCNTIYPIPFATRANIGYERVLCPKNTRSYNMGVHAADATKTMEEVKLAQAKRMAARRSRGMGTVVGGDD